MPHNPPMFPPISDAEYEHMVDSFRGRTIIAFRGEAGVGKDTIAKGLIGHRVAFNAYIYEMFEAISGIPVSVLDTQETKAAKLPRTDTIFRTAIINMIDGLEREHPTFKAFLMQQVYNRAGINAILLNTSVRRPVELDILADCGALLITIDRPDRPDKSDVTKGHITERINDYPYRGAELKLEVGEGQAHIDWAIKKVQDFILEGVANS